MKEHIIKLHGRGAVYMVSSINDGVISEDSNDFVFITKDMRLTELNGDGYYQRINGRFGTYIKYELNSFINEKGDYAYKKVDECEHYEFTFRIQLEDDEEFKQTKLRLAKVTGGWLGEGISARTIWYNGKEYDCDADDMCMAYDEDGEYSIVNN